MSELPPSLSLDALRFPAKSGSTARLGLLADAQGWAARQFPPTPTESFDHARLPLDHDALEQLGLTRCLSHRMLPLKRMGGGTIFATSQPDKAAGFLKDRGFRSASFANLTSDAVEAAFISRLSTSLTRAAEDTRAAQDSCRDFRPFSLPLLAALAFAGLALCLLLPAATLQIATILALLGLAAASTLKLVALLHWTFTRQPKTAETRPVPHIPNVTPKISLFLPLLRESKVAETLVRAVEALEYPRQSLEVLVLVEDDDFVTKFALDAVDLAPHFKVINVPRGRIKTKPRAMNYALPFATGDIIGIYDAEDHPEHDQLRKVAAEFAEAPPQVACLQGRLDFYNARENLLARCFTLDYAAWFGLVLPALVRFDMPVPLGGTTLFLRRHVIEELGGWDAYNVTEDAELGMMLYRKGYRVRLLDSTTFEEANCRAIPWVKQRSRWLKGYVMTWLAMMRQPRQVAREMGWKGFATFQIIFAGTIVNCATTPLIWAFLPGWIDASVVAGGGTAPGWLWPTILALFLGSQALTMGLFALAAWPKDRRYLMPMVPLLNLYFLLSIPAVFKGLWETLRTPHSWDKTEHGVFLPGANASSSEGGRIFAQAHLKRD